MVVNVKLTSWEMMMAAQAGTMRQLENLQNGKQATYGAGHERDWQYHIEGCLGEFALAKFLDVHWGGKGRIGMPDVGTMDVRTRSRDHYELILHPADPDDRIFWLLCGLNGQYSIKGWIRGREGKQTNYWQEHVVDRPAYFVPQTALYSPYEGLPKQTDSGPESA